MATIAVLGLGAMGRRMAERLVGAGHDVVVWNRSAVAIPSGTRLAATPRTAVTGATVVLAMLRDDVASQQVWTDAEHGALSSVAPGTLVIESSTLTPAWLRDWAGLATARGAVPLEAPVSGSRPQAAAGQLVFFLGGDADAIRQAAPVLTPLAASAHPVGPIGAAAVVKLMTNMLLALQIGAWAELLPMLSKQGVDVDAALSAVAATSAWAPVAGGITHLMRQDNHAPNFPIDLIEKDMGYVTSLADTAALPLANLLRRRFQDAQAHGLGAENMTALVKLANH